MDSDPSASLGADRDQPDAAFGQRRQQMLLVGGQGDIAVRHQNPR